MADAAEATPPAKGGRAGLLVVALLGLLAIAGGFSLPLLLSGDGGAKPAPRQEVKRPSLIAFGDAVVVNLGGERLTRYLRVKLLLVVDESDQKPVNDVLAKQKAFLKSWLISYLSDLSSEEVAGAAGVNRVRREIRDQFNAMLYPDGAELIHDILFDEFVVQ